MCGTTRFTQQEVKRSQLRVDIVKQLVVCAPRLVQLSDIWQKDAPKLRSDKTTARRHDARNQRLVSWHRWKLFHLSTLHLTQTHASHSLSCFEVPHVCRGTPGLLIIALPADFSASIPRCVCSPPGGFPSIRTTGGEIQAEGSARRRMHQIEMKETRDSLSAVPTLRVSSGPSPRTPTEEQRSHCTVSKVKGVSS